MIENVTVRLEFNSLPGERHAPEGCSVKDLVRFTREAIEAKIESLEDADLLSDICDIDVVLVDAD